VQSDCANSTRYISEEFTGMAVPTKVSLLVVVSNVKEAISPTGSV